MTIFCDTNIILEYLQQRAQAEQVGRILSDAIEKGHQLFISIGSFYTITYLTERYLKKDALLSKVDRMEKLRYILNGVLDMFTLVGQSNECMRKGVNDILFEDLEDSYQASVATEMNCEILLTINERHFVSFSQESAINVMSPQAFIDKYIGMDVG